MNSRVRMERACLVLLLAASWSSAFAQSVQFVVVGKHIQHVQTSATAVQVDPTPQGPMYGGPYGFSVNVEGPNVGPLAAPVVSGPFNAAA